MVTRVLALGAVLRARPGAWFFAAVWTAAACCCVALHLVRHQPVDGNVGRHASVQSSDPGTLAIAGRLTPGLKFSDAVQIPGTDDVLLVDDDVTGRLFRWRVGRYEEASGPIVPVDLPSGLRLEDGEGITTDGRSLYAIGSHSLTRRGAPRENLLMKLRWAADGLELEEVVTDLESRLISLLTAGRFIDLSNDAQALDIEGLAWDPAHDRLLLGLRSPLWNGEPIVVPLRLVRSTHTGASVVFDGQPLPIPGIRGVGIRSIQYDPQHRDFLVLTGSARRDAPGDERISRFSLWEWSGARDSAAVRLFDFPERVDRTIVKPEGVCRVTLEGDSYVLVVSDDAPYYWKVHTRSELALWPLASHGERP